MGCIQVKEKAGTGLPGDENVSLRADLLRYLSLCGVGHELALWTKVNPTISLPHFNSWLILICLFIDIPTDVKIRGNHNEKLSGCQTVSLCDAVQRRFSIFLELSTRFKPTRRR